jgi:hypothetical protein
MLGILITHHFLKIAVIFITFSLVLLFFTINIIVLIINIIKKHKKTLRRRIFIVLSGIGIIISVLLSWPYLKLFYKISQERTKVQRGIIDFDKLKEKTGVDTIISWDKAVLGNEIQRYFTYENKKYIKFDAFSTRNVNFNISDISDAEINKLAGIILDEDQEKDTFLNGLYGVLFPKEVSERVLYKYVYTVKNCNDLSLLIVKRHFFYDDELFCDEEYFLDKYNYYNDIYNYNFFISKNDNNIYVFDKFYYIDEDKKENISHHLSKVNFDILTMNEEKYNYQGNRILIPNSFDPKGREYEYINIYGISGDGVYKKLFKHYIIDNDDIYCVNVYNISDINAVKLNNDEKVFLLSLLE